MDNITHSLAGLLLASLTNEIRTARDGAPPNAAYRRIAAVTGIVAANLPDADLLYAGTGGGPKRLDYLLQHRGYTHTIIVALLGALLAWSVALAWWRWIRPSHRAAATSRDRWWLLALCLAGTLSHIALDYTNSYGVHPFWPIHSTWYYGDAVFILEPWLWAAAIPALALLVSDRVWRIVLGVLLVAVLAVAWIGSLVPWGVALALTLGSLTSLGLVLATPARRRASVAAASWLLVELTFFVASSSARAEVRRALAESGATPIGDVALSPATSNPLCYDALVIEADASTYRVSTAAVAPFPRLLAASRCAPHPNAGTVTMTPSRHTSTSAMQWAAEWSAPRGELAALQRDNCVLAAALHFIRIPVWRRDADAVTLADVRYDGGRGGGFATITAPTRSASCPTHVPSWRPPRSDVLGAQ